MKIENRLNDVDRLITEIIQEYVAMILNDNWKNELINYFNYIANNEKGMHYKYADEYNKLCEKGKEAYSIKDMDITFMYELIRSKDVTLNPKLEDKIFKLFATVVDDRNEYKHISYNEDEEELYLMGLLHLCHICRFLQRVHTFEMNLSKKEKDCLYEKYIQKINDLKDILDYERIQTVEYSKKVENLINNYFNSKDKKGAWLKIYDYFYKKPFKNIEEKNKEFFRFCAIAYERGVLEAKYSAVDYYLLEEKNYKKVERILIDDFKDKINPDNINYLFSVLYSFKRNNNEASDEFKQFILKLKDTEYYSGKNKYKIVEIEPMILSRKRIEE